MRITDDPLGAGAVLVNRRKVYLLAQSLGPKATGGTSWRAAGSCLGKIVKVQFQGGFGGRLCLELDR